MKWLVFGLILLASQASAECVDFGTTGLVVPVVGDVLMTSHDGWDILTLEAEDQAPQSMAFRSVDIFGFIGGEVLENGMTFSFETTTEKAKASGQTTAVLRGKLNAPLPFEVRCSQPGDMAAAEWCLPLIKELRTKAEGCATGDE